MAFSVPLQGLIASNLQEIYGRFSSNQELASRFFFYIFRKFIEQEKHNQTPQKDFDLNKFENLEFITCLKFFTEQLLGCVLNPYKLALLNSLSLSFNYIISKAYFIIPKVNSCN